MDAGKISVLLMTAVFFGSVAYLAVVCRRNERANALERAAQKNGEPLRPEGQSPRNAA
jgi:hypothetical protein